MKTLTRQSFDEYRQLLDSLTQRATKGFSQKIAKAAYAFMNAKNEQDRAGYRSAIVAEVYGRIDVYRSIAQVRADDMFRAMTGYKPTPHDSYPYEAAEKRVRSAARNLFVHNDMDAFIHALESFITKGVRAAANVAMAENVEKANRRA